MLKRLYVHNYKCLVNFEINFDKDISLFLGENGSGKSTVFEVLTKLRKLIVDEEKIENIFDRNNRPRNLEYEYINISDIEMIIHFELEIEINKAIYKYVLLVSTFIFEIKEELLYINNEIYVESKNKETILFQGDEHYEEFSFDNSRSNLNRHTAYTGNFVEKLRTLFVARINSYEIFSTINKTTSEVNTNFSNYSEWFSYLNEGYRREVLILEKNLATILNKFEVFRILQAGRSKILQLGFKNSSNEKEVIYYDFEELSEGQKCLIALYTLIYCTPDNSIICIDEPENFLALPEIQPWLNTLRDQCRERNLQCLLISHHPSLINLLATDSGYWFSRQDNHTRIEKIAKPDEDGLSLAQLIEMGWIYGD